MDVFSVQAIVGTQHKQEHASLYIYTSTQSQTHAERKQRTMKDEGTIQAHKTLISVQRRKALTLNEGHARHNKAVTDTCTHMIE